MNAFARSIVLASVLALAAGMAPAAGPPAGSSTSAGPGGWPPLPPGTRTILLLTGADLGHLETRKCFQHRGGMVYRRGLDEWLFDHEPGIDWHWISTGNVLSHTFINPAVRPPRRIYEELARVGYDAVGVGWRDLQLENPFAIRAMTSDLPVHLVATNLRVLETGRPFLEDAALVDTASGQIAVLAIVPYHGEAAWASLEYGTVVLEDPARALEEAIESLPSTVEAVVLLANMSAISLAELLENLPAHVRSRIDLVAGAMGTQGEPRPGMLGTIPFLRLGAYGKYLGRVAIDGNGAFLDVRGIPVEGAFPIDPRTGRPVAPGAALPRRDH